MNKELWGLIRHQVWSILCQIDDHFGFPRFGSRRPKE